MLSRVLSPRMRAGLYSRRLAIAFSPSLPPAPPPRPPSSGSLQYHSCPFDLPGNHTQDAFGSRCGFKDRIPSSIRTCVSATNGTPPENAGSQGNAEQEAKKEEETTEAVDEKTQVLRAALRHVPKLGWSEAAIVAGARDVGLSPAIVGAFPRKEADLVEFFMDECLQNLLDVVEDQEDELSKLMLQERIAKLVRIRLEMQVPYVSRWAQALSIQAHPANVPTSFKQRAVLIDEIWHAVGDRSSDMDWYAKRGMLAAVYTATELYMLTDYSPDFHETWSFLERRVKDALDCRKTAQEVGQLAQAVSAGLSSSLQSFLRRQS